MKATSSPRALTHLTACLWLLLLASVALGQGYAPDVAASKMAVAEGLAVTLFASEPEVRQPILVKLDNRGRLWTIQYLQYPNPAGLKRVKVDRWSRTIYDRVPEPPPRGPRGADRITILEDTDRDGKADRTKDFVDGLNLCTGLEFGHGGLYVLQVPYLLFYADADGDDVPDGDPKVLLSGFGMEDAQSLANHLTFGPDGWLYGVNGSTTTCNIRGIEFQQGVWRYHPQRDEFELFCEGGGNLFGLTFDERGNLFYSSNGGLFYHALQGAYFEKNFGKHGSLHNLYAYGHLSHVENPGTPGSPTTGGTVYLGDTFPSQYRGTFLCGDFLGHTCSWWNVKPQGTTFAATRGGTLLAANDTWFGATDLCYGPDGAVYVADFHDQRTAHPDPDANWDRSNGRIYRIAAANTPAVKNLHLEKLSSGELVELLKHPNRWYADRARVILPQRRDAEFKPALAKLALESDDPQQALQGLWGLNAVDGLSDEIVLKLLRHAAPDVRCWTVRLLADRKHVPSSVAKALREAAKSDDSAIMTQQLAASARRLPGGDGLPIVFALLDRDLDDGDPRTMWSLWWAIEAKAVSDRPLVVDRFARGEAWKNGSWRGNTRRLVRRYAAEGTAAGYDACLTLLQATPPDHLASAHEALALGLSERARGISGFGAGGLFEQISAVERPAATRQKYEPLSPSLKSYIDERWQKQPSEQLWLELALRSESQEARKYLGKQLGKDELPEAQRVNFLKLLGEFGNSEQAASAIKLVSADQSAPVQAAAIEVVTKLAPTELPGALLKIYSELAAELKGKARAALLSHPQSALALLSAVDAGRIAAAEIPLDQLRLVAVHHDARLDELVRKHWGNIQPGTAEEKLATIRRLMNDLRAASGDASAGKALFGKHCATCHKLFGEGNEIGPDLTQANRGDRAALLANVVDPAAVVRRQYINYAVTTDSGRILTGLIADQDAASITIVDAKNQRTVVPRDQIEELNPAPTSLMPERLLEQLTPQELRDLFAYLEKR
jgi:putative membrane-bound dehydrogenase-like protein